MITEQNNLPVTIEKPRIIGTLFLLAFIIYGIGRNIFESELVSEKYTGALLIFGNSIIVLLIGVYIRKSLLKYNYLVANIYLFSRIIEAIALSQIILNIFYVNTSLDLGYFIGMIALGLGSIPMCFTLLKHKIIPKWLSIWGIVGYSVFTFGFIMELFGKEWSMYFLIMGGFWELYFGFWLIFESKKKLKYIK